MKEYIFLKIDNLFGEKKIDEWWWNHLFIFSQLTCLNFQIFVFDKHLHIISLQEQVIPPHLIHKPFGDLLHIQYQSQWQCINDIKMWPFQIWNTSFHHQGIYNHGTSCLGMRPDFCLVVDTGLPGHWLLPEVSWPLPETPRLGDPSAPPTVRSAGGSRTEITLLSPPSLLWPLSLLSLWVWRGWTVVCNSCPLPADRWALPK